MFDKTKCSHCGKKFEKNFSYCPFCGNRRNEDDFFQKGLLDALEESPQMEALPIMFSKIFNDLERQFKEMDKGMKFSEAKKMPMSNGISISVNMSDGGKPMIKVKRFGDGKEIAEMPSEKSNEQKASKQLKYKLGEKDAEKLSKLPKAEPETTVRRFSDKIVYEINLPGVEKKNIIVNKLQNSIEVKAFSKDKAFMKLIPVSLPLKKWQVKDGKLIIELKPEI
jgi:HSP20 family molecular chaperone IbpA